MKKDEYIYPQEKKRLPWKRIGLTVLVLLAVFALVFTVRSFLRQKSQMNLYETFRIAVEEKRYHDALTAYHNVQSVATDLGSFADDRETYRALQEKMEVLTSNLTDQIISNLKETGTLSEDEKKLISGLNEIAAAHITPQIRSQSEEFLDGNISQEDWHRFVYSLSEIPSLSMISNGFLEQEDCLAKQVEAFAEGRRREIEREWRSAWRFWESLINNNDICRFARDYAQIRLKSFQENQYELLLNEAKSMLKADQFYSAEQLLTQLVEVFPQRQELNELLNSFKGKVPSSVTQWKGDVLVLSVRPLVARKELAFGRSGDPRFADNSQITTEEFISLLKKLQEQDFVLVSPSQYTVWPERKPQLFVPEGKKPVILVFDRWEYTVLDQICGTAGKLFIDNNGVLMAEAGLESGREFDATTILEDYIALHPEFSFDGAKALISLNLSENFLGYYCGKIQEEESKAAWARVGQEFPEMTEDEFKEQNHELGKVMNYLLERGFDFASGGFYAQDTANLNEGELSEDLDLWIETVSPYLTKCRYFVFPNGSHVYHSEELLQQLLDRNMNILFGEGPGLYHFMTDTILHFDRIPINESTLSPSGISLRKHFDPEGMMDEIVRNEGRGE